ncbi:MAG: Rha family transcriptional regulator [Mangrovibacterium sp.]
MNDLVFTSKKGAPVTNSLLVAEKFEKRHDHILRDIKNMITKDSTQNWGQFFYSTTYGDSSGKQNEMYIMNRDGFSLLVMGFTGIKALRFKIDYIDAFNKMEEALKSKALIIPQTYAEALELAAKQAREIEEKDKLIERQAPAVDFVSRAVDSGHLTDIGQAAKILKLPFGRNTFFKTLRQQGILFKNRNEPKQEYIDRGYFELREDEIKRNEHPSFMITKILVTQKGLFWLSKIFKVDYSPSLPTLNLQ